jgi:hypothetical protein
MMRCSVLLLLILVLATGSLETAYGIPNIYMPTVTTTSASKITDVSAKLNGVFSIKSPDTLKTTSWQFTVREGRLRRLSVRFTVLNNGLRLMPTYSS